MESHQKYVEKTFEPAKSDSLDEDSDGEAAPATQPPEIPKKQEHPAFALPSSETVSLTTGEEEECWFKEATVANIKFIGDVSNSLCHVCGIRHASMITDYTKFSSDVLQHCICCGLVVCSECLAHEIRDGRRIWPIVPVDHISTVKVCKKCVETRHPNLSFEKSLAVLSTRCVQACLELMRNCDGNKGLRLHMGVGSGEVLFLHVGGLKDRWEFLVAGESLMQMGHAEGQSKSGEICVSPETWALIKDRCEGEICENSGGVYKVGNVAHKVPTMASTRRWSSWSIPNKMKPRATSDAHESAIVRYIPGAIRTHLAKKNLSVQPQTAELRKVSVLFVNLKSCSYNSSNSLVMLQKALMIMQASLYQFEGSLRQFIMDDKGTTLIGVFGLYPFSHENDALLATRCALEMQTRLQDAEIVASIGVTTGSVYSGSVGSYKRNEYAVVGDIVNLSARLMVAGFKMSKADIYKAYYGTEMPTAPDASIGRIPQPVLCDLTTHNDASSGIKFCKLTPIMVKGKKDPIDIFFPIVEAVADDNLSLRFVGQKENLSLLRTKIENLDKKLAISNSVVVIDGPLGIGKSRILSEAMALAASNPNIMTLQGTGDPMEESSNFFAFRPIFAKLLNAGKLNEKDNVLVKGRKLDVVDIKSTPLGRRLDPTEYNLIPLLRGALPDLDIEDTKETKDLVGATRNDETIRFMIRVLLACSPATLISIENGQWLDPSSWKLILRLTEALSIVRESGEGENMAIFITVRQEANPKKMLQDR